MVRWNLAHGLAIGVQRLLLLPAQVSGNLDLDRDVLVAPASAVDGGDAFAPQAEGGALLYSFNIRI